MDHTLHFLTESGSFNGSHEQDDCPAPLVTPAGITNRLLLLAHRDVLRLDGNHYEWAKVRYEFSQTIPRKVTGMIRQGGAIGVENGDEVMRKSDDGR